MFPIPSLQPLRWLLISLILVSNHFLSSHGDVGTAARYSPPYLPTGCYGGDQSQFPSSNLFAAAGDGIWDNGASCGRQYLVRCISASTPYKCMPGQTIQIRIVDSTTSFSGTMVLSETAYNTITNSSSPAVEHINIEFQQV